MEKIASLFDWVVAGPVTLAGFARHYPVPFAISFISSLIAAFLLCEDQEGPKRAGYTLLGTYMLLIFGWLIASWLGGLRG